MHLSSAFFNSERRKIHQLVENQTSFTASKSSMHIFETHQQAHRVELCFSNMVLASMISGKKHMHLSDTASFDFLPGESVVLPPEETMCIDFPIATKKQPTRCLALEIEQSHIDKVIQFLNETQPRVDDGNWMALGNNLHFSHDNEVNNIIQRLIFLYTEDHPTKDFFIYNMLQELMMRLLQQASLKRYNSPVKALQNNEKRFGFVIDYIKSNLDGDLSVETLSRKACMSSSHFYKAFKRELGMTPTRYVNKVRIQAARHLIDKTKLSLTEIFLSCGFNNRSYFNRQFKKIYSANPGDLRA